MSENEILIAFVSVYQGKLDPQRMVEAGLRGVYLRGMWNDWFLSPHGQRWFEPLKEAGLAVGWDHLIEEGVNPAKYAAKIAELETRYEPDMPPELDVERKFEGLWNSAGATAVMTDPIRGRKPLIYTAAWVESHDPPGKAIAGLGAYPLHVADYRPNQEPELPTPWSDYLLHQFSADGNGLGPQYGVESDDIALSRFNGTETDFIKWIGGQLPTDPDDGGDGDQEPIVVEVVAPEEVEVRVLRP